MWTEAITLAAVAGLSSLITVLLNRVFDAWQARRQEPIQKLSASESLANAAATAGSQLTETLNQLEAKVEALQECKQTLGKQEIEIGILKTGQAQVVELNSKVTMLEHRQASNMATIAMLTQHAADSMRLNTQLHSENAPLRERLRDLESKVAEVERNQKTGGTGPLKAKDAHPPDATG